MSIKSIYREYYHVGADFRSPKFEINKIKWVFSIEYIYFDLFH